MALVRSEVISALLDLLSSRITPSAWEWFSRKLGSCCARAFDRASFLGAFASAARFLGRSRVRAVPTEAARLEAHGLSWPVGAWGVDELARAILLVRASESLEGDGCQALVEDCFRDGDARERQSVLRALPLLPRPERLTSIGVEGCNSPLQPVFEAIACENPFPALHFGPADFNEMVLGTLARGLSLGRIVGLDGRTSPELVRLATAYAQERLGAGRALPAEIGRLLAGEAARQGADRGGP